MRRSRQYRIFGKREEVRTKEIKEKSHWEKAKERDEYEKEREG